MTDVNDSCHLEQNLTNLMEAMSQLDSSKIKFERPGELRFDRWLKDVQRHQVEVDDINKMFVEVTKVKFRSDKTRHKLNMKVLNSLKAANDLKARADEISHSVEIFMNNMATWKTARFLRADIDKYISDPEIKIGSGEFGDVYKVKLANGVQAAVKILKGITMKEAEKKFIAEVSAMSKTYHRNLARLYGYCFDPKMIALVYEYFEYGSLENMLDVNHRRVDWSVLYGVAVGTARALSYLHEHCNERIIHRDIKPGNVLLDTNYVPKISDFGLAKFYSTDKTKASTTMYKRSHGYDSPEVRLGIHLTYKCDVFSYGMMLLDILRRNTSEEEKKMFARHVWDKFEKSQLDQILEECGIREKDKESAEILTKVALCCIQEFAEERPSMSTVLKVLEKEMQLLPPRYPFGISGKTSSQG